MNEGGFPCNIIMKLIDIIRISIGLLFVVIFGIAFATALVKGNYDAAAIYFIGVLLNVIPIIMLISEK